MKLGAGLTSTLLCVLTILGAFAHAKTFTPAVDFSLRMGGSQAASQDSKPNAAFATGIDYNFYRTYVFGVGFSYLRQVKKLQTETSRGYEDVLISLSDKALWKNRYHGLTLSAKAGFISPVSEASREASQIYGLMQSLTLKKEFSDRFNFSYILSANEYQYGYSTVDPAVTDDQVIYNNAWRITNRALMNYDILRGLHWGAAAWVHSYRNTNNQSTELRGVGTAFTYDITKMNLIDLGVSSTYKSSGPDVWDSPTYSNEPFHRDGVMFYFGTTIKI
jgi:hypothetical protein